MRRRGVWRGSAVAVVVAVVAGLLAAAGPALAAATVEPGAFVSLPPTRVLDTRSGLGAPRTPVAAAGTVHLDVLGHGGVPNAGVSAVLLNVTVTGTGGSGYVTAYPDGATRPTASNLNFAAGQTVANLVAVQVGADGGVALYNGSGRTVGLLADVAGWYAAGEPVAATGAFVSLPPTRLLDTRTGLGAPRAPVAPTGTVHLQVTGRGGVPAEGVSAVLVNVTVTNPTASGYVTVHPDGATRPTASNLNFGARQTVPNLVAVPVGDTGGIALFNGTGGRSDLLADVAGYYLEGDGTQVDGSFVALPPTRVLDTRSGNGTAPGPVAPTGSVDLQVTGRGGVATADVAAVLLNVTVTRPTAGGYVTAYPTGSTRPTASNLNFTAGRTVANLVAVRLSPDGRVTLFNGSGGRSDLVADVAGYVFAHPDTQAPDPVTDVQVTATTTTSATLTWTDPADADLAGVTVRRAPGTTAPADVTQGTLVADTQAGTVTDTGLVAGTTYSYALFAHDATPNHAAPATITVTTDVGPTGALVALGTVDWGKNAAYSASATWADPDVVHLASDPGGLLEVVTRHTAPDTLSVDTFDPATRQRVGTVRTVSLVGWSRWGGFLRTPDGDSYVLVGRDNPTQNDALDVIAVRRYDPAWNLVGTAYVQGGASQGRKGVYQPFVFGAAHMVQTGDTLVVHTSRTMYALPDGGGRPQSNFTFQVDLPTMTTQTFEAAGDYLYVSHSWQQLVAMNGTSLVLIDHGDAFPRAVQLGVYPDYPASHTGTSYPLFPFNGPAGTSYTGATVTGLISGPTGVVVLGTSIQQPDAPLGPLGPATENRNVYAVAADPATGDHSVQWLTDFPAVGTLTALEPRVVQVSDDRWAVLFSVTSGSAVRTEYRLLDSAGVVQASATFDGLRFSAGADPLLLGTRIWWAGSGGAGTPGYLYGLDVTDPTHPVLTTG